MLMGLLNMLHFFFLLTKSDILEKKDMYDLGVQFWLQVFMGLSFLEY